MDKLFAKRNQRNVVLKCVAKLEAIDTVNPWFIKQIKVLKYNKQVPNPGNTYAVIELQRTDYS